MAKFKVGDRVRRGGQSGVVKGVEKEPYIEVKFTNEPVTVFVHEEELVAANVARSRNAVVQKALNASRARNAKYKLSSKEAKAGDLVRVAGALGTYVVTKEDGDWIEITDAEDGTPHGRVEARYATPVEG